MPAMPGLFKKHKIHLSSIGSLTRQILGKQPSSSTYSAERTFWKIKSLHRLSVRLTAVSLHIDPRQYEEREEQL